MKIIANLLVAFVALSHLVFLAAAVTRRCRAVAIA